MANKELTEREKEILDLVAEGMDRQEMADSLGITLDTIGTHKKNIHLKVGAMHLTQLVVYAIKNGFGKHNKRG